MYVLRIIACAIAVAFFGRVAHAQEKQPTSDELFRAAKYVVEGKVERTYASELSHPNGDTDKLIAFEVYISRIRKGESMLKGETIFVKAWRANSRPAGYGGPLGQIHLPANGDLVELYLSDGLRSFNALTPNGIRIIAPGKYASKTLGLRMAPIPAGEFDMGSHVAETGRRADEEEHRVRITKPFLMGVTEVTQEQYQKVMKANPSWFSNADGAQRKVNGLATATFPVERVTWFNAIEFCNRLSKEDGLEPYYQLANVKRNGDSIANAIVTVAGGKGYRLPTEAEWEYACRAGTTSPFHYGRTNSGREANIKATVVGGGYGSVAAWRDLGRTAAVGSYPANAWGLFDMHGNVGEWCWDWYDKDYITKAPVNDPTGPDAGTHRVMRGGAWLLNEGSCRAASRFPQVPTDDSKYYAGFRIARNP